MSKYTLISSLKVDSSSIFRCLNKLTYPLFALVIFLAVRDKDVVIVSFDYAYHFNKLSRIFYFLATLTKLDNSEKIICPGLLVFLPLCLPTRLAYNGILPINRDKSSNNSLLSLVLACSKLFSEPLYILSMLLVSGKSGQKVSDF